MRKRAREGEREGVQEGEGERGGRERCMLQGESLDLREIDGWAFPLMLPTGRTDGRTLFSSKEGRARKRERQDKGK